MGEQQSIYGSPAVRFDLFGTPSCDALAGTIGLAFAFSALGGVVFGSFLARRAARLDLIEALRH